MTQLAFTPRFIQAMHYCRAAVYVWFGLVAVLLGGLTHSSNDLSLSLASAVLAFVWWLLVWLCLNRLRPSRWLLGVHVVEAGVLVFCANIWMLPVLGVLSLMLVALAANTALWGWRRLLFFVPAVLCGFVSGTQLESGRAPGGIWWDAWFVGGGVLFVLTICAVAHSQAQQLLGLSRHLRRENHTLLRYLPSVLPEHLVHPQPMALRQQWLTVAFIDLAGFTKASLELPQEALIELLNGFMAAVDEHVECWDGHVSKFLGDGALCVFTAPDQESRANAAAQAVRCVGLLPGLLRQVSRQWRADGREQACTVRCGVASGYCCVGDWGGNGRLDYTVIGAPVNLAQRLQSAAGPYGGVLIDAATQRLLNCKRLPPAADTLTLPGVGTVPVYGLA